MDTMEITLNHVDGQNIVYWEDIEQAFPGVKRVSTGYSVIKFLRGPDQQGTLDVVLSTSVQPALVNPAKFDPVGAPVDNKVAVAIRATPPIPETPVSDIRLLDTPSSPSSTTDAASKATLFQHIATRASRKARESEIEQRLISLLTPEVQETVRASSNIYQEFAKAIKHGNEGLSRAEFKQDLGEHFQKMEAIMVKNSELEEAKKQLQEQIFSNHEEMKQLQQRTLDQLVVLQSRVQAVLTQTYELHEYPIPRLFVVIPQDPLGWDAVNPFSSKFRLYFLCECGEHTKSADSKTKISHNIHFAMHEGYEIARPSEFFQQYGFYVLTILKMLKFGVSVAGVVVPAISHLVRSGAIDQATASLQQLRDNIVPGMDHIIDWMDEVSVNEGEAVDEFSNQMEKKEALEGADLRKLGTFLKDKDGNKVLGNLYRTVTNEGHVKWVCIDHYRMNYLENSAKEFMRVLNSVGGSFSENDGRVGVRLQSRAMAEAFFSALEKARSVYELDISLHWACTTSDLEALEDVLKKSRMSCELASKLIGEREFGILAEVLKTNSTLTTLNLKYNSIGSDGAKAMAEVLKTNSTLTTLDLSNNSIGDDGAKAMAEALKTNSTLTTLDLFNNSIGDDGAKAMAEALKTNSTLTTLNLEYNSIGDDGAKAMAETLKTNSTLTTLDL
ncbi:hypothetical protein EC957_008187 [Mortierella hygrophila]|uniref:RNI-like protein n=1 Tax=Mortierella hygrophila TaxID=979708 RepID=A0A9P6FJA0_9FUNG|nr:hypothetical protein EC957_008187 [Mortierella hygrophila]